MHRGARTILGLIAARACTSRVALGQEAAPANARAEVTGEKVEARIEAPVASVRIVPSATKAVNWRVRFVR